MNRFQILERMVMAFSVAAVCVVLMSSSTAGYCISHKNVFAYVSYEDGTIAQYRISPAGQFGSLSPATIKIEGRPYPLTVTPNEHHAYVSTWQGKLYGFEINEGGILSLIKSYVVPCEEYSLGPTVIDSSGRFLYATVRNGDGDWKVLRRRINTDGTLSVLQPAAISTGPDPAWIAADPRRPFLYTSNGDSTISQYRISEEGRLLPLQPATVYAGNSPAYIAISPDGKYLYVGANTSQSINQFLVNEDGTLTGLSSSCYATDVDTCCGTAFIAADPSGTSVVACNALARNFYCFRLNKGGLLPEAPVIYKSMRDNKLKTRKEILTERADRIKELSAKDKDLADWAVDWRVVEEAAGNVYCPAYDSEGNLYILNSSGVGRFKVHADDRIECKEFAVTWPDVFAAHQAGKDIVRPEYLVIIQR